MLAFYGLENGVRFCVNDEQKEHLRQILNEWEESRYQPDPPAKNPEMIRRTVNQLEAMETQSHALWRRFCQKGLPYFSVMRSRRRQRLDLPLWQSPGPKKTVPLDWKKFYPPLLHLEPGRQRSKGTGALYQSFALPSPPDFRAALTSPAGANPRLDNGAGSVSLVP